MERVVPGARGITLKKLPAAMKIRGTTRMVGDFPTDTRPGKLQIDDAPGEVRRVVKRLKTILLPYFESARRMGVALGPDDLRAVFLALTAEADGLNPDVHLQCPMEVRHYIRRSMFEDLVGEPSNILYTTQISKDVIRYEAMPVDFWKQCLTALTKALD